jgi:hypothetical protein
MLTDESLKQLTDANARHLEGATVIWNERPSVLRAVGDVQRLLSVAAAGLLATGRRQGICTIGGK